MLWLVAQGISIVPLVNASCVTKKVKSGLLPEHVRLISSALVALFAP